MKAFMKPNRRKSDFPLSGEMMHWKFWLQILLSLFLLFQTAGCGSDGGADTDSLGIGIDDPSDSGVLTLSSREDSLTVGGFVSESPLGKNTETGCFCGFACLFYPYSPGCYYTRNWPRVIVTLTNQANSESTWANIVHDPDARTETSYRWSASVPLVVGGNRIVANADDGKGNEGSATLKVDNP